MSAKKLLNAAVALALFVTLATGQNRNEGLNRREMEQQLLEKLFQSSYNKDIAPSPPNGSTIVTINMYVRSVEDIDDANMEFKVQLTFRQQWLDNRLAYDDVKLPEKLKYLSLRGDNYQDKLWTPDLFFSNERSAKIHNVPYPNSYVRIFPNGEVLLSSRISLTLFCPMIFVNYPFDAQSCAIRMASYGFTTDDIIFKWKSNDPVQVTSDLHLPGFALTQFSNDNCDSTTTTGTYSCLRADFQFVREVSLYMKTLFFPSILIIIIAWSSFWISRQHVTGRILVLLFSLASILHVTKISVPSKISYSTSEDFWRMGCLLFVLFAHLEYMTVLYISKNEGEKEVEGGRWGFKLVKDPREWFKESRWGDIIDIMSRILYIVVFAAFSWYYFAANCGNDETDNFGRNMTIRRNL